MKALLSLLLGALRLLPPRLFPLVAALLGAVAWPFLGRERRRLQDNVDRVLGLPPGTHFAKQFERQVLRHQVLCTLETLRAIQQPELVDVRGEAELAAAVAAAGEPTKGLIMITAHLGSWELCAYYGQKAVGRPFHVLAKPARSPAVTAMLERLRERMSVSVLWTDRKSLLRDMLGALKGDGVVGFVMDQKPEGRVGPVVPFFGQPTAFVAGPAAMAIRTGCGVVSIFCLREGPFRYRLVARTLLAAGHGETDELRLTERLAAEIEALIRAYPEQWTWNYKRWRFDVPA